MEVFNRDKKITFKKSNTENPNNTLGKNIQVFLYTSFRMLLRKYLGISPF